jgi:serine protease
MRLQALLALFLTSCLGSVPAFAVVRNVPGDYPTIQQALNASTAGDIVLVAPGTYMETLVMGPSQDGVTLVSQAGPAATIVDGNFAGASVLRGVSLGPNTAIEGFTFRRGGALPTTTVLGGGISLSSASPRIENNVIKQNVGASGGGMYVDRSSPTILNNVLRENQAIHGSGGGIYFDHFAEPRIEDNVIVYNRCAAYGAGLTIWDGSRPQVVGNTIAANEAALDGGGIFVTRNSHPQLTRNIVASNPQGGGLRVDDFESTVELSCNDVWGNLAYDYSGLPNSTGANGNISADPIFCNLAAGNFHIRMDSPCTPEASPPGCGLIGALGVGCSPPTAATTSTWGRMKAAYR